MIDIIMELTDKIRQLESNKPVLMPDRTWFYKKRKERQLTMRELASLSDVSLSLISRLEAGKDVGYHAVLKLFNTLIKPEV
jgi:predicted transcriptional regulator